MKLSIHLGRRKHKIKSRVENISNVQIEQRGQRYQFHDIKMVR